MHTSKQESSESTKQGERERQKVQVSSKIYFTLILDLLSRKHSISWQLKQHQWVRKELNWQSQSVENRRERVHCKSTCDTYGEEETERDKQTEVFYSLQCGQNTPALLQHTDQCVTDKCLHITTFLFPGSDNFECVVLFFLKSWSSWMLEGDTESILLKI